jgi:hypothetical protein
LSTSNTEPEFGAFVQPVEVEKSSVNGNALIVGAAVVALNAGSVATAVAGVCRVDTVEAASWLETVVLLDRLATVAHPRLPITRMPPSVETHSP